MAVVTPILILYARRIALKAAELTRYPITEDQLKQLDRFVPMVVAYIDELVSKALKGLVKEAPKTSNEKQALALKLLREQAPSHLDRLPDETLKIAVDAAVHDRRVSIPSAPYSFPPPVSSYPPPALPPVIAPPRRAP